MAKSETIIRFVRHLSFLVALTASQERFNEYTFMCSNRTKPEYFTRNGKMSFKIFKELMDTISRNCVPIRPDRSNERRTKKSFLDINQKTM